MGSSKPNISRIPMKPSVAWRTALLSAAIDLLDLEPAVPAVLACWLSTSAWLCTDSFESELSVPSVEPSVEPRVEPSRFRLLALRTMVATVRQ